MRTKRSAFPVRTAHPTGKRRAVARMKSGENIGEIPDCIRATVRAGSPRGRYRGRGRR